MKADERARAALPIAAELICAVADYDPREVARIIGEVTDWQALAVLLAANISVDQEVRAEVTSASDNDTAALIVGRTAERTGVPAEVILSLSRDRLVTDARAVAMFACHRAGITFSDIGRAFERDHTTAIYAVSRVGENARLREVADKIVEDLFERPADEHDKKAYSRRVACARGCGRRTPRASGVCRKCEESA